MTNKAHVLEEALNAAVRVIQDHLGVTDGGWASMVFSGRPEDEFKAQFGAYYDSELNMGGTEWVPVYNSDRDHFQGLGFDLPELPRGWTDQTWINDACANYRAPGFFVVYLDHPSAAQREIEGPRFTVFHCDETGAALGDGGELLATDSWALVLAFVAPESGQSLHPYTIAGDEDGFEVIDANGGMVAFFTTKAEAEAFQLAKDGPSVVL